MDNTKTTRNWLGKCLAGISMFAFALSLVPRADAIIIFQNDDFFDMESPNLMIDSTDRSTTTRAIQFGNTANVANLTWSITNNRFEFDKSVYISGGLTATGGNVNFSSSTQTRLRETATVVNGTTNCQNVGEVIVQTSDQKLFMCTAVAPTNTWKNVADGATASNIVSGASNPATCTQDTGAVFYNTTTDKLYVCTAPNTWTVVGPDDFETVFNNDADKVLTTSNQTFGVNAGTGNINLDGAALSLDGTTSSNFTVTGNDAGNVALTLSATNAGAGQGNVAISAEDQVSISSSTWNISGAGVASGLTGITSTGNINFSGSSQTRLRETATVTNGSTACTNTGEVIIETSTNTMYICTDAGADTWKKAAGNKIANMSYAPEFPDAVVFRDGSNNVGTLVGDYDATSGVNQHYYGWTSTQATTQDIEVRTKVVLPNDFSSIGNLVTNFVTGTTTAADNKLDITILNATDLTAGAPTQCATIAAQTSGTGGTWTTNTITSSSITTGCTGATALHAGDIVELRFKLYDNSGAADYTRLGSFTLNYNN